MYLHFGRNFANCPQKGPNIPSTLSKTELPFLGRARLYLEMVRFSHTIFAMPFALLSAIWCLALANREGGSMMEILQPLRWLGMFVCMVSARNFAMTVNRIADRRQDAANPRTEKRHLPAGLISVRDAAVFASFNAVVFLSGCLLFLPNWLPVVLASPVLAVLAMYSFVKRWSSLVHFFLGFSLMLAPVCVWVAFRGEALLVNPADLLPAGLLGLTVLLWVTGFDVIYATQDSDFDRRSGHFSLPARLGVAASLRLAALLHLLMLIPAIAILFLCPQLRLGWIYGSGVALIAIVLVYENWLVNPNDLSRVNLAFFQANAVVGLVFLVAGGLDSWW